MNCASMQRLFSAWIDGEMNLSTREEAERHLADCPTCQAQLAEYQQLDQQLRHELRPAPLATKHLIHSTLAAFQSQPVVQRPRPWRVVALAVTSAAAGFLLAVALLPELVGIGKPATNQVVNTATSNALPIQLALAIGVVEYEDQGVWKPLATGATLQAGQHLRTLARSRCELRCADGSELRLNYESDVIVHSPRQWQLNQGQVWSTVAAAPAPFQIKTVQSTVTALGTQFDLQYHRDQTRLTVVEGKTRFDLAGKTTEVGAGQQLELDNQQGSFDIRSPDYALFQATNWVNEILVLKGRNHPELTQRINDLLATIGETKMGFLAEEEMRTLGDHCVLPLCRFIQSERSRNRELQRQTAARIVSDLAQPRSIGDMIELLSDADTQVRTAMARGLHRLTKQEMGFTAEQWKTSDAATRQRMQEAWRTWWNKNAHRYPEAGGVGEKMS